MGFPGRKPKPTHLKVLEGNPGKRPLPRNEPKPRPVSPKRPAWLTGEARREWERLVPELSRLGLLTIVDGAALAGYCQSWADYVGAVKLLKAKGKTFESPNGYVQQRPEVSIAQKSLQLVKAFCAEFGLTPSSRGRLSLPGEKDDDFDGLLD